MAVASEVTVMAACSCKGSRSGPSKRLSHFPPQLRSQSAVVAPLVRPIRPPPALCSPPTTHANFSWELEGASPATVQTETVKQTHTPAYNYCGTFAFDRRRKSSLSFFKFKRCVIEVIQVPPRALHQRLLAVGAPQR